MEPADRERRLEAFRTTCRKAGLPLTFQRRAVLEAVLDLGTHPTADEVHQKVSMDHRRVSRATVYRTLEELVRRGLIVRASHLGRAMRYDARPERHHHLVCTRCDRIIDIDDARLDRVPVPSTVAHGFEVVDLVVQLRGVCRSCRQLED